MSNEELVAVIQAGATDRMSELWEQVAGLVKWKARHIMIALNGRGGVEFDDMYQAGYPALVAAVETYDPAAGAFSTWYMYYLKNAFAEATGYRTQRGRKEPLDHSLSLDKPMTDGADSSLFGEFIPDPKGQAALVAVEEREYRRQLHEVMEKALATLPEQGEDVLRLRYYQGLTLEEVGELRGVGAERVRQMENQAVRRLRRPETACYLRPFYDFDYYCGTGLNAFRYEGMSIQERYLIIEEDRKERERQRCKQDEDTWQLRLCEAELLLEELKRSGNGLDS